MFTATGLLSNNAPPLSDNPHSPAKPPDSETRSFAPNGLLMLQSSPKTPSLPIDIPMEPPTLEDKLISNGLLGTIDCNLGLELAEREPDTEMSFVTNGLLSKSHHILNSPLPAPFTSTSKAMLTTGDSLNDLVSLPSTRQPSFTPSSVRATTHDGSTLYLKRKPRPVSPTISAPSSSRSIGKLLDVPIHRLLDITSSTAGSSLQKAPPRSEQSTSSDLRAAGVEDTLWVDRYRPRKFTDLLGNEKVARDAMTWVKNWDHCVFGKVKGKKRSREDEENINLDEFRRPQEKILLLSGPPGLGKTTLAHVIARQAGYEIMEINASDARSASVVDDRIRPALESGSAVGSSKPVLLVIDEIDGATGSGDNSNTFIHKLVQLVHTRPWKKERSSRAKQNRDKRPILRPIICICNDYNASSLAKLRPHSYHIRFNRPADTHIVKRLKEICVLEGLKAETRALSTLVSVAKGDLRGCLNTLQFIRTRNEDVTETVVRQATVGMKEEDTTLHSVLNNVFTPLTKKRVKELGLTDEEETRYVTRLAREIDGSGRDSAVAVGCFGHYATLRRHDANLAKQERAMEWLTTFDHFSSAMYSDGDFSLNQYLPYTLIPFYPLFQDRSGGRVERNQADWDHLMLTRSNEEIYKSLARCVRTATIRYGGDFRHLVSAPTLQVEFAPYINRIISPPLRPVNSQIVRPNEKALMTRLVDIMSTLELRFVLEKAEDGQLTYRLDPPIDVFVTYDGKRAPDIAVSRYAVRQLVSGEIDAKLIARDTEFIEKGKRGKHDFFGKTSSQKEGFDRNELEDISGHSNKRAKTVDNRDIADKPPTDFFGRLITVPSVHSTKGTARKNVEKDYRVSYRFLEGNSAAVRRPVKVSMFL